MELVEWSRYHRTPTEDSWQPGIRFKDERGKLICQSNYGFPPSFSPTRDAKDIQIRLPQSTWVSRCKVTDLGYFSYPRRLHQTITLY